MKVPRIYHVLSKAEEIEYIKVRNFFLQLSLKDTQKQPRKLQKQPRKLRENHPNILLAFSYILNNLKYPFYKGILAENNQGYPRVHKINVVFLIEISLHFSLY